MLAQVDTHHDRSAHAARRRAALWNGRVVRQLGSAPPATLRYALLFARERARAMPAPDTAGSGGHATDNCSVDAPPLLLCVHVLRARGLVSATPLGAVRCEAHWRGVAARTRGARAARRGDAQQRSWRGEPLRFADVPAAVPEEPLTLLLLSGSRDALLGRAELSVDALRRAAQAAAQKSDAGGPSPAEETWLPLHDWARGRRGHGACGAPRSARSAASRNLCAPSPDAPCGAHLRPGELLVRVWAQASAAAGAAAAVSDDAGASGSPDTPGSALARQLARIRAVRPVLLAGASCGLRRARAPGPQLTLHHPRLCRRRQVSRPCLMTAAATAPPRALYTRCATGLVRSFVAYLALVRSIACAVLMPSFARHQATLWAKWQTR